MAWCIWIAKKKRRGGADWFRCSLDYFLTDSEAAHHSTGHQHCLYTLSCLGKSASLALIMTKCYIKTKLKVVLTDPGHQTGHFARPRMGLQDTRWMPVQMYVWTPVQTRASGAQPKAMPNHGKSSSRRSLPLGGTFRLQHGCRHPCVRMQDGAT